MIEGDLTREQILSDDISDDFECLKEKMIEQTVQHNEPIPSNIQIESKIDVAVAGDVQNASSSDPNPESATSPESGRNSPSSSALQQVADSNTEKKDLETEKRDKFGGTGIIPYDITRMSYDEYVQRHHTFLIDRYHSFMNQNPNFFNQGW